MHGVAYLLAAAAVGHILARALRLPAIPFLIAGGVVLSQLGAVSAELVQDALLVGVSVLLFLGGLELDTRRMRAQRRAALQIGAMQFVILSIVGFGASRLLGYDPVPATYLALALTASSTLVCVRVLQQRRQMYEPFGRLVLGALLLQDLLVLLMIPVLQGLRVGMETLWIGLAGLGLICGLALAVREWVSPIVFKVCGDRESLLLTTLGILFGFLALGSALGLPAVVGAFLAGVSLARFPISGVVRIEMIPLRDFFASLFFTALGALVVVPSARQIVEVLLLVAMLYAVTVPLVTWLAERSGFSAKSAIEAGLMLSQASEISLVIGLAGILQGHIGAEIFTVIVLVTMVTMLLTPLVSTDEVAWKLLHLHPGRWSDTGGSELQGHLLLLGAGSTGMPILEDLILAGIDVVVVDDDPRVLARLHNAGVKTLRGDASDPRVVMRAGAPAACAVISTIRRTVDNQPVLDASNHVPVLVRVFDESDAEWVRARGGTPLIYSEATAEAMLDWFEEQREWLDDRLTERVGTVSVSGVA